MNIFRNSTILITGGTGSWGYELTRQLLVFEPKEIRIFSRGEINQVAMERKFLNPKLRFVIGDIRDKSSISKACQGVDYVFHLAALKHVPICEVYPDEAIKTNIDGTRNLIQAAIENNVTKVIDVSTDKAVVPINLYGMTKAIGEKLILRADVESPHTRFSIIRGGNALGSNGSVVPHFINQIKTENKVDLTDERMTRYFLSLTEAVKLVLTATESPICGGIFVMKMPSFKIKDIAEVLISLKGNQDTKINVIGMRSGEKIHEVLVSQYESPHAYVYSNQYYLIHSHNFDYLPKVDFDEYNSMTLLSTNHEEIVELLKKGGFV